MMEAIGHAPEILWLHDPAVSVQEPENRAQGCSPGNPFKEGEG